MEYPWNIHTTGSKPPTLEPEARVDVELKGRVLTTYGARADRLDWASVIRWRPTAHTTPAPRETTADALRFIADMRGVDPALGDWATRELLEGASVRDLVRRIMAAMTASERV